MSPKLRKPMTVYTVSGGDTALAYDIFTAMPSANDTPLSSSMTTIHAGSQITVYRYIRMAVTPSPNAMQLAWPPARLMIHPDQKKNGISPPKHCMPCDRPCSVFSQSRRLAYRVSNTRSSMYLQP